MFDAEVNKLTKALILSRKVVGVRFLYYKAEYERVKAPEFEKSTSYCVMTRRAMDGMHFKATSKNCACRCAAEAIGLEEEMPCVKSGERYFSIKLHETRAIAHAVMQNVMRIPQRIYGFELGPLDEMEAADVVMFMTNAYQLMRVVEGYCYKFGPINKIRTAGDQGVCADLTAAPFVLNDINISVLCAGTRKMCNWSDSELGVGLPINKFSGLVDGVVQTLNYIEYPKRKKKILAGLDAPGELGIAVDEKVHYKYEGKDYVNPERYKRLLNGDD